MFALTATRRSGGVRRLLLLTTAVRHASALTAVVALRAQSNLLPVRHRALRCAPALLAWEPPPGFKEWKEGDVPFDEEEDDRSFDMFDLVSDGPERRPGFQRRASSPEDFVEALLDVPAGCCPGCGATFQSDDPDAPGFVPQSVLDARSAAGAKVEGGEGAPLATRTETICQRCHAAPAPILPSLTPEPDPTRALPEVSIAPPPAPGATACATRTGCRWRPCAWARRRSTRSCSRSTSASCCAASRAGAAW